jgi:two-component system C4-dicarboxylate transport sensor histidine kinase DctB
MSRSGSAVRSLLRQGRTRFADFLDIADHSAEDRMGSGKRLALFAFAIACAVAVVAATYFLALKRVSNDVHDAGSRQLQIIALDLESVLEKFETLPFALSYQAEVMQVLDRPGDRIALDRLNNTLQAIQRQSKVGAIYMMDVTGRTLASSNWDQPLSFVGRNFSFRPYFREAMQGGAGRFYGIGSATGEPGYFIAQPVYPAGQARGTTAPIGVVAVKIDLGEFEHTWRSSEDPITLTDRSGVVFLSNRPNWKYHSLHPLDKAVQQSLAGTLQYAGKAITPIASLAKPDQGDFGEHVSRPVGRLGWQLMLFPSQTRIARGALLWAAAAALLLAIGAISWWAAHQRRRRLEEQQLSRQALQKAADELDARIALRTQELLSANLSLETKYAKLQQTENMLRSTQNELVQAGKLAMLGQMAAGVTHELNQPLAAIRAFADNAGTFLARGQTAEADQNLSQISAASARMGKIIGQLKGFARKSSDAVSTVDLRQAIEGSALLLGNDLETHQVALEIDVREPVQVLGDTVRTEQVVINLLRNALDAVEGAAERKIRVVLAREGDDAVIRIRDSGGGIPQQVAPHLFEPFFTTKSTGKGLGLGLTISSSIVQAMNGQLTAHNHPEGGAEFVVRLPLPTLETES